MVRTKKIKKKGTLDFAINIRKKFQLLLRKHIKTRQDREKLAKAIGITEGGVHGMLYHATGGLNSWIKAFAYCYKLNEDSVDMLEGILRRENPLSVNDKLYFDISNKVKENKLYYYLSLINASIQIEEDLTKSGKKLS